MIYVILGLIILILLIYLTRYIVIGDKGSLIGIIAIKVTGFFTYIIRNNRFKLKKDLTVIKKYLKWNVKEKDNRNYSIKKIDINGLETAMIKRKIKRKNKVILQLHGGGYESDLTNNDLGFAKKYLRYTRGIDILTIKYRVAPEYKYPAALEDAVKAYKWLNENGYKSEDIIIAGDSAGGGLTLACAMYLRDNNIPLPIGIITMSAWTDLTNQEESFEKNFSVDPIFGHSRNSIICTSSYAEGMDKKQPYISPMYGDFNNFPDILMQVGSHEMLLSDTVEVAKKMKEQNINVIATVYRGMFHNFQKYNDIIPEADRAWREVRDYIREIIK